MKQYKLAIFDMDGTILNTLEDLTDSTNYALRTHGMPERSIEEVRMFVGNGIGKLIKRAVVSGTSEEETEGVLATFKEYYGDHCAIKTRPYDGIVELLKNLKKKGFLTAVVSNKADFAVRSLVQDFYQGLFDAYVGEKEGIRRKPAPDSVNEVLQTLQIEAKDAVYIGDSDVDLETAKNSNMDCIAVEWGFRGHDFLVEHGATTLVQRPEQIEELLTLKKGRPSRGIVLEGGGMRGLYTAGVLDVFMEQGITMDSAVGVSAGAVFGCNYKSHQIGRVVRYNKRFCRDSRFVGIGNWIRTGNIHTKEFAYGKVPYELDVFDSEAYEKNPMDFYVVVTDTATGDAKYQLCNKGDAEDIEWMRASAAIPMAIRPVEIGDSSYVDGGVSDSIPVKWMAEKQFDKLVVVLTRPLGYEKAPRKAGLFTKWMLRKYPKVIEAMVTRHIRYNQTLQYIQEEEQKGNLFVIRPSEPISMPILFSKPEDIQRVYDLGRADATKVLEKLQTFLQ